MKQAETIKTAHDWLDAILCKLEQSDHPAALADVKYVKSILKPLLPKQTAPKVRGFEDLTIKLEHGYRQFNRDDAAAAKASEGLPCVLCRQPVRFARLAFWFSPHKPDCGYAHMGCFQKAELERDYRWNRARTSEYDAEKAVICLCGHGYQAHKADKAYGGTDYIECESSQCNCDHFRPGGTLKEDAKPDLTIDDDGNRADLVADNDPEVEPDTSKWSAADRRELARINADMAEADEIEAFGRDAYDS